MKKILEAIKNWWLYQVLKKERTVETTRYIKGYKNSRPFYMKKIYKCVYVGSKCISSIRIDQKFISKKEYYDQFS